MTAVSPVLMNVTPSTDQIFQDPSAEGQEEFMVLRVKMKRLQIWK